MRWQVTRTWISVAAERRRRDWRGQSLEKRKLWKGVRLFSRNGDDSQENSAQWFPNAIYPTAASRRAAAELPRPRQSIRP
jgi:hypothetical protein